LQITVIAVEPVELTVSVGAPVIVQVTGEDQTVPVPLSVLLSPPVARVPVKPVQSMLTTEEALVASHVTTGAPPEFASKNTVSDAPGTLAPPLPPDVVDQFVVLVEFQVPVPARQYLDAMYYFLLDLKVPDVVNFDQLCS